MSTVSIFCPGQAAPAFVYAATAAVLIVLAICGQAMSSFGREGGGCPDKSERGQAWGRAFGRGLMRTIGNAAQDFKMRFGDFWLRVNYYYPPDENDLLQSYQPPDLRPACTR